LLDGILGAVRIAQDPEGQGVAAVDVRLREVGKCAVVA
jgi:hypothetical protein